MNIPLRILTNTATWRQAAAGMGLGMRHAGRDTLALLGLATLLGTVFLLSHAPLRSRLETQVHSWLVDRANARLMPSALFASSDEAGNQQAVDIAVQLAEPEAIARVTAADLSALSRQQAAVVQWISKRYAVAQEPVSRLAQEAWSVGKKVGIDPTLILAVIAIESRYNPFAQSHVGAQGLMQVMTKIHQDKYENFGGKKAAFDPVTNLRVGVQVLKDCIKAAGSVEMGLKHYVGAANLAHDSGYGAKVLAEQSYLKQVMAGQKVATTVTWPKFTVTEVAQLEQTVAKPESASGQLPVAVNAVSKPAVSVSAAAKPELSAASTHAPAAQVLPISVPPAAAKPAPLKDAVVPAAAPASAPTFSQEGAQVAMAS